MCVGFFCVKSVESVLYKEQYPVSPNDLEEKDNELCKVDAKDLVSLLWVPFHMSIGMFVIWDLPCFCRSEKTSL